MPAKQSATPKPKLRWFIPMPGHLLIVLLIVEVILLLSERLQWFAFNEHKGWSVLIAVAAVGVFLVGMLLWFILALVFRWRFQFSVRSLLLLTIAVAIPSRWLPVEMQQARKQRETVENLLKLDGSIVTYDYEKIVIYRAEYKKFIHSEIKKINCVFFSLDFMQGEYRPFIDRICKIQIIFNQSGSDFIYGKEKKADEFYFLEEYLPVFFPANSSWIDIESQWDKKWQDYQTAQSVAARKKYRINA